jgi:ATP-dependent Clp protease protease subunit
MGPIFLRGRLDDALASSVIAQLLLAAQLTAQDSIDLYIDSPGGTIGAALGVYDCVKSLGARVSTTCSGTAGGSAVLILAAGAPARRAAMPNARIHLTDDAVDLSPGRFNYPEADAEEARRATARWRAALLQHTSQSPEQLAHDMAAGRWLSASEAVAYGLVDRIGLSPPQRP